MKRLIQYLILLLPMNIIAQAPAFKLSDHVVSAYIEITQFNKDEVRFHLQQEHLKNPVNPFSDYLQNTYDFYEFVVNDNLTFYRQILSKRKDRLEHLESADQASPFFHFTLAEFHLQWSIMRLKAGEEVLAAKDLRKAFQHWESNQKKHPEFYLNLKPSAILHALGASIPSSYKWLSDLAGISGNGKQAQQEILQLENEIQKQETYTYLLPEIRFIRFFIESNLLGETPPSVAETANNCLSKLTQALAFFKQKNMKTAALKFQECERLSGENCPPIVYFFLGECYLNESFDDKGYFDNYLQVFTGKAFLKSAWRKKGWMAFLRNDTLQYRSCMKQVLSFGNTLTDDDRQAQLEANSNRLPNTALLKARLLHDGGQFDQSNQTISTNNLRLRDSYDAAEFWYRLGRNCQGLKQDDQALTYLKKSIEIGKKLKEYFAASAAFQCGLIYEQRQDRQAELYYKMVLSFPDHPYKKSLDAKAGASLKRLKIKN
jgi:tetratricopeptide (TPR) repeat protein